jgi:hypothetical protein
MRSSLHPLHFTGQDRAGKAILVQGNGVEGGIHMLLTHALLIRDTLHAMSYASMCESHMSGKYHVPLDDHSLVTQSASLCIYPNHL